MKKSIQQTSAVLVLSALCALPFAAHAQDSKRALAVKLAQIQIKNDSEALSEQLVASAAQPLIGGWSQRLDESVPPARQKDVRDKLDVELKKYVENTRKTVEGQVNKSAEAVLVPIYMEKFSEEELKTVVAYLESPVSTKFQTTAAEATQAWAKKVVDSTKSSVESGAKSFDAAATKIVNGAGGSAAKSNGSAPKK